MVLVQIQVDQTQGAEQRFLHPPESDTRNWAARDSFGCFFVGVGVELMGLGSFRKRWEIRLSNRRIFPHLASESGMPAPAIGIMPVFS